MHYFYTKNYSLFQLPRCNDQGVYLYSWYVGAFDDAGIPTTTQTFSHGAVATLNAPSVRIDMWGRAINEVNNSLHIHATPYVRLTLTIFNLQD